jgi:hypothetical protein
MTQDILQQVQEKQFDDRPRAESLLLTFIHNTFPALNATNVELRPQAVSLNSFNGIVTLEDDSRLFFKAHTEADTVIDEYYNATLLEEAGYPIIKPLHISRQAGNQLLIYELIEDPSVFDLAWAIEQGEDKSLSKLTAAQNHADDALKTYYLRTLAPQTEEDAAAAPIHQLFYHRLTGGRLERFYGRQTNNRDGGRSIMLPAGTIPLDKVRGVKWIVNDSQYDQSLNELIMSAIDLLQPAQPGPSVIGHGDAHNGNVFYRASDDPPSLLYFDPAFAGRHDPLLDLAKPLFHNVFAMWMYFPQEKARSTSIEFKRKNGTFEVKHVYEIAPVRHMFLRSKIDRTLIPILQELRQRGLLRPDWRRYLKAALFCCPFLTLDLTDTDRFPPEIALLGLTMAVEMGAESENERSLIDQTLDDVERVLAMDTRPPSDRWYR